MNNLVLNTLGGKERKKYWFIKFSCSPSGKESIEVHGENFFPVYFFFLKLRVTHFEFSAE